MTSSSKPAIIHIVTGGKNFSRINYSRRMYAIIRRYTPNVVEGESNECLADLTGLRTFFKMTYAELAEKILQDLEKEIGVSFTVRVATLDTFEKVKNRTKKIKSVATFKEINTLFRGASFVVANKRKSLAIRKRLTIPYLGKVS